MPTLAFNFMNSCGEAEIDSKNAESSKVRQSNFKSIPFNVQGNQKLYDLDGIHFESTFTRFVKDNNGADFIAYSLSDKDLNKLLLYTGMHPRGTDFYLGSTYRGQITNQFVTQAFERKEPYTTNQNDYQIEVFQDSIYTFWIETTLKPNKISEILIYKTDKPIDLKIHLKAQLKETLNRTEFINLGKSIRW